MLFDADNARENHRDRKAKKEETPDQKKNKHILPPFSENIVYPKQKRVKVFSIVKLKRRCAARPRAGCGAAAPPPLGHHPHGGDRKVHREQPERPQSHKRKAHREQQARPLLESAPVIPAHPPRDRIAAAPAAEATESGQTTESDRQTTRPTTRRQVWRHPIASRRAGTTGERPEREAHASPL